MILWVGEVVLAGAGRGRMDGAGCRRAKNLQREVT